MVRSDRRMEVLSAPQGIRSRCPGTIRLALLNPLERWMVPMDDPKRAAILPMVSPPRTR